MNERDPRVKGQFECDVCRKVIAEEERRIREFVALLDKPDILRWLGTEAVFCIPHTLKLRRSAPLALTSYLDRIIRNYRNQLRDELAHLRDEPGPYRTGWGAVGRAAEFLVAQRGLRT